MSDFGLSDAALEGIRDVFTRHPKVSAVKVYGSRAMGTFRPESDIDLAVYGDVDGTELARVLGELDELPLPYFFDVLAYSSLTHSALRSHIDRLGRVIFERAGSAQRI